MENAQESTKAPGSKAKVKARGPCIVCGRQTPRLCQICGKDFVCSDMCNADNQPAAHMPTCVEDEFTTGYDLKVRLVKDLPPTKPQTIRDFGFDRCDTDSDKQTLLGIYYTVVVAFGVSGPELNRWSAARELYGNIAELFDNRDRAEEHYGIKEEYVDWFKKHAHIFDGGIHGSGAGTKAEETGAFWPNLRGRLDRAFC